MAAEPVTPSEADERDRLGRFFLFIGSIVPDAAVNRVKASGALYRQKRLESSPENWLSVLALLQSDGAIACVTKLTGRNFNAMTSPPYAETTDQLLHALGRIPHLVLVHQHVLTGEPDEGAQEGWEPVAWPGYDERYEPPSPETRAQMLAAFKRHGINFVPYETNAELSVLASQFVEENERNLLLRVYVPTGRLFSEEAGRLLGLFREWLVQTTDVSVSQRTYSSGSGQVYELVGDDGHTSLVLSDRFDAFQQFIELCEKQPEEARLHLMQILSEADRHRAEALVFKYARESKRLRRDLHRARERKVLELKHQLEEELDEDLQDSRELESVIEALVPGSITSATILGPGTSGPSVIVHDGRTVNQQFIAKVEGHVIQSVQGDARFGPDATQLLGMIRDFGGPRAPELESALHELHDQAVPSEDRLRARQKLKGFLIELSGKVGDAAFELAKAWVESQVVKS